MRCVHRHQLWEDHVLNLQFEADANVYEFLGVILRRTDDLQHSRTFVNVCEVQLN